MIRQARRQKLSRGCGKTALTKEVNIPKHGESNDTVCLPRSRKTNTALDEGTPDSSAARLSVDCKAVKDCNSPHEVQRATSQQLIASAGLNDNVCRPFFVGSDPAIHEQPDDFGQAVPHGMCDF